MSMTKIKHGRSAYVNLKCRCDVCRLANKLYHGNLNKTPKGRAAGLHAVLKYRENDSAMVKIKAQWTLNNAVRTGKLQRGICAVCGNIKTQAHHKDYTKPLDVIWLCGKDHKAVHIGEIII